MININTHAKSNILSNLFRLDIIDLNYNYSSELYGLLDGPAIDIPQKGIILRLFLYFAKMISAFIHRNKYSYHKSYEKSVLFFARTKNQKDTFSSILTKIDSSVLIEIGNKHCANFPLFLAYLISIPFLPVVILKVLTSKTYVKRSFAYSLDSYWVSYGLYVVYRILLNKTKSSVVILSNDHVVWTRALKKAAEDKNIPTIYMQHATVRQTFPILDFSYAFLDGIDAFEKYRLRGKTKSDIFLIGNSKFDQHSAKINTSSIAKNIGLCTNTIDPLPKVEEICSTIRRSFPDSQIVFRPHPSDNRFMYGAEICDKYSLHFSSPKSESSFDYLSKIDALIVGESGILLEAVLMNVYPLYFVYAEEQYDYYDFVKNQLVDESFYDIKQLCNRVESLMHDKPIIRNRAKRYVATIDTEYDGKSTELAIELISEIKKGIINLENKWIRLNHYRDSNVYILN